MPFLILIAIIVIPFIEISVFIDVGGEIGVLPTLLLTILTAGIGGILIKTQGLGTVTQIRTQMDNNEFPFEGIFDGFMILTAGILLFIPGFVTDAIGLILFLPPVRKLLYKMSADHQKTIIREDYSSTTLFKESQKTDEKTIDVEYKDKTDKD